MKLNRILLVSTNRFDEPFPVYPLALSYLKSSLNHRFPDLSVRLFDINTADQGALQTTLASFRPELVGISLRNIDTANYFNDSHFVEENRALIAQIKHLTKAIIVIGGAGFSIFPEVIFSLLAADYGIKGEGEESLCQLVTVLRGEDDFSQVQGLLYRDNGKILCNERNSFCQDPTLDFDVDLVDYYWKQGGMLSLQTKRGCPYNCIYCSYPLLESHTVRTHDPGKVVAALKKLSESRGIDYFYFADSVFNVCNEYNRELAEAMIAARLNIHWGAYFTPHHLDLSLLTLLKKSGLTHIEFGTESLSNITLKSYNKKFTVDEIVETADYCRATGIHTAHFMILGGYGETQESLEETLQNSKRIEKAVFFPYFGMRIYPNTCIHEYAIAEGKIDRQDSILEPTYYLADHIDWDSIKKTARATKNRWVFPDENLKKPIKIMRNKGMKGPLWEMLIK